MARPNVKAEVRKAAMVEKGIVELIRAVGNGANTSNAGNKVKRVVDAAAATLSTSGVEVKVLLISIKQLGGRKTLRPKFDKWLCVIHKEKDSMAAEST